MAKKKEINYILQIKCFYEWMQRNDLSASAIALWHGLMYMWNQSFWESRFTPAMSSIIARTGLSKSTVYRAREELVLAGLLKVRETKKCSAAVYKLVPFLENSDTIYKLNNTKQNKTKQIIPHTPKGGRKEKSKIYEKDQGENFDKALEFYERMCNDEVS